MIKVVFLDFDGTISDARKIAERSLVLTLDEFGFEYDKKKVFEFLGIKMRFILKELGLNTRDVEKVRKVFYRHFIGMALAGEIKLCVSLKPLWKMKDDFSLVVVSNSDISFLKASIKVLKLKGLFDRVYGVDKVLKKDEVLKKVFMEMGIKASEAVYVGDRFSDIKFARNAGCVAVAMHNRCSWSTLKKIKEEKPDYIVRDFYGLRKILRGHGFRA